MGRADLKKEAIERIDELIIGPMLAGLAALGDFAILLMPDHATPSQLKTHSSEPVPFALMKSAQFKAGGGVARRYTEADGTATGLLVGDGYQLIESLFGQPADESPRTDRGGRWMERNLALEVVRATEAAALAAARFIGKGDERMADRAACDAMRKTLNSIAMDGKIVIGEGDQADAEFLYNGEIVGTGAGTEIDVALDALEGALICATGGPNALSCVALAERGESCAAPTPTWTKSRAVRWARRDRPRPLADRQSEGAGRSKKSLCRGFADRDSRSSAP